MRADSTIKASFVLSCGIHVAIFSLFSFVIALDLGSAMPSVEVIYIGSSDGRLSTHDAAFKEISIQTSPSINLPDRMFANESVVSDADEGTSFIPMLAGKIDLERDYSRSKLSSKILNISSSPVETTQSVVLDVKEEYTVEESLSTRKVIIRPPSPEYPQWAIKGSSLEVDMKLRVTVNPQGVVERVESVQSTGYPKMDLVASRYIKQWRFESRALDTESETGVVSVKFRLK